MKVTFRMGAIGLAGVSALALAACGDSNDASDEVMAEDVEMPADEAMDEIDEEPVEDTAAPAPAPAPAPANTQTAEERAEADRANMQDDAEAAEAAAADIMAEIEGSQE